MLNLFKVKITIIFSLIMAYNSHSQINIIDTDSLKIGDNYVPEKFSIGGAVRLNYAWQTYNDERKERGGDFGFELSPIPFTTLSGNSLRRDKKLNVLFIF